LRIDDCGLSGGRRRPCRAGARFGGRSLTPPCRPLSMVSMDGKGARKGYALYRPLTRLMATSGICTSLLTRSRSLQSAAHYMLRNWRTLCRRSCWRQRRFSPASGMKGMNGCVTQADRPAVSVGRMGPGVSPGPSRSFWSSSMATALSTPGGGRRRLLRIPIFPRNTGHALGGGCSDEKTNQLR
jgi:hypothetical protein